MMVIGSFASYTKIKSVESAVWCLLTLDNNRQAKNQWEMQTKQIIEQQTK